MKCVTDHSGGQRTRIWSWLVLVWIKLNSKIETATTSCMWSHLFPGYKHLHLVLMMSLWARILINNQEAQLGYKVLGSHMPGSRFQLSIMTSRPIFKAGSLTEHILSGFECFDHWGCCRCSVVTTDWLTISSLSHRIVKWIGYIVAVVMLISVNGHSMCVSVKQTD